MLQEPPQTEVTAVFEVGLLIFLLNAYDHYTGSKRGRKPDGGGDSKNLMYKKLYFYILL